MEARFWDQTGNIPAVGQACLQACPFLLAFLHSSIKTEILPMTLVPLRHRWYGFTGWCGLMLFVAVAGGCSPGKGKVSGKVLLNGKPLPGGTVMFHPVDSRRNPVSATIDEAGNYEATVPVGEALVRVDNRGLQDTPTGPVGQDESSSKGKKSSQDVPGPPPGIQIGPPAEAMKKMREGKDPPTVEVKKPVGTYVKINEKYHSTETSGLKLIVTSGSQNFNIDLK